MCPGNLSVLNPNPIKLRGPSLLHHLVAPTCHGLALEYRSRGLRTSYTYRELHDAADAIACHISDARRQAGRDETDFIVPVLIPQSPLLYISLVAILKAGGAFCPLHIDAPRERIKFIAKDVSAQVILVSSTLAHKLPLDIATSVIRVDQVRSNPSHGPCEHRQPSPDDLAYVMYTSGSTGNPKGVCVSHAAATQALLAHDPHIPPFSRFLQFAAPTFDVSVFEIFYPLFRGATLVAVCRDEMLEDLPSVLRDMNVDACELTPTVAASLLRNRQSAPSLKLLLTIGEMLSAPIVEEFGGSPTKPSILWAMYGPTEATIHCTLQAALPFDSTPGTIGTPLDTVSCFVIEPCGPSHGNFSFRLLPRGEIGELAVGGHQLARGYLNRPEQTASAFIPSPYGRVYRTGDRARLTAEGKLECFGRLANGQVKLRGQRVELGEIEQAALSTPGCHGAVAAIVDSNLVVFCAVDPDVTEDAIVMHCQKWLPLFMIPGEVIMLAAFPQLPSGKVDLQALKSSYGERKLADLGDKNNLEEADEDIVHAVSRTLGRKVSGRMTLASAGVDSLSAISLASALRLSGFVTTASELLKLKTISELCSSIRNRTVFRPDGLEPLEVSLMADLGQILAHSPELSLEKHDVEDVLPCSSLQSAMLAETVRDPQLYSNEMELQAAPGLTPSEVADAIRELAKRNEILRSGFAQWRGGFVTILYKTFDTTDGLQTVRDFQHGLSFTKSQEFLRPLRFQICAETDDLGLRLLVQAHHAVYDGWSMDVILSDLSALLRRVSPPPRQQFREVLRYHARESKKAADDLARKFWSEHLLSWSKTPFPRLTARLSLPSDIQTTRKTLKVPQNQVQEAASQAALSTQVPFQASLGLLWSGITGERDMVLGSVTSGRTIPVDRVEEIIGPCVAALPLRVNLDSMVSCADLLKSIQASNRAIMEHCGLALSEVKKITELQPTETLYDVLFVYQQSLEATKDTVRLLTEVEHIDRLETKLLFEIQPGERSYAIQATYHRSWFPPGLIECLMQQFESTLLTVLEHPNSRIQPGLASTIDSQSTYNEAKQSFPGIPDLATQFEAATAKSPNATALCFKSSSEMKNIGIVTFSYRELNESANQIAHYLGSSGVRVGEVLAIIMHKSPIFYTSVLGIAKAGCAYLPILPTTPEARVRGILKQARVRHCLVDKSSGLASVDKVRFHPVEDQKLVSHSKENKGVPADPSRLAYVIYTSGTTGEPKGVAVTQKNIVSNIAFLRSTYPAPKSAFPRLLQACSQAFDVSVFEIFFAWHAGMCLCAAANDDMFDDLENSIRQLEITHLSLTPTVASLVDPANVPDVEFLVTAGEPMTKSVLDRWDDKLWQGYGPSETTNICSVKRMRRGDNIEHLGWTLPNTSAFVMNPSSLEIVPMGWMGEFCFGGDQVAMGYLNDARLTREKFIDHPKFGRIYRSGDVGRMLPDGSLIIIGRLDDQIKLRGQRIEAGEINSIITSTHLAVAAVTISARRGKGAADQLVSFYVPTGASSEFVPVDIDQEAIRQLFASLSTRLPSYMVPSYVIPVSQIPVGSSGKIDRRRLQACFEGLAQNYMEAAASTTKILDNHTDWTHGESVIADVLAHSAGVAKADIGRWTPFAALGVDSITAIGLSRMLNSKIGVPIPISAVLQNPTVAQLAKYVEANGDRKKRNSQNSNAFVAAFAEEVGASLRQNAIDVEDIYPCTPLQEGMLSQGSRGYFNKILLRLRIRAESMRSHWRVVSHRHAILRTCFITTRCAAHPIAQVVLRKWEVPWRSFEVSEPILAGAMQEHLGCLPEPLDTGQPPVSCAFIRHKDETFFSLICHHAMYDGVAMDNLWREIEALANGCTLPPAVAYKPFIQKAISLPDDTDAFWVEHFRDFQPSILFPRLAGADTNQCKHSTSLGVTLHDVQKALRSLGVSMLSACQAAWATLISIACGRPDVAFGNVVNGRTVDLEGLDRLVAPCFNTVPLRADLSRGSRNVDVVRHFQDLNARMLRYQFTSLRHVRKVANCPSRTLFDTLLLLQRPSKDMDESVWTLEEDSGDMDVPLVCEIIPQPNVDSIIVSVHYDIELVSGDAATALADTFKCLFSHLIHFPFASPHSRSSIPGTLQLGIASLVPRRVEMNGGDRQHLENETWSDSENMIRQILSELSGVPENRISRQTGIFRLGLDSINAVQVASMLKRKGYEVSASDVVQYSSCARLAPRLLCSRSDAPTQVPPTEVLKRYAVHVSTQFSGAVPSDLGQQVEAILPTTSMQAAMLAAFDQSEGQNYLNMLTYRLNYDTHIDDVLRAWEVLHRQHPMLRTGFASVHHKESPFAMVRFAEASTQPPVEYIIPDSSRMFDLQKWQDESRRLFLQCPRLPPWKVILVNYGDEVLMNLIIHHALYDAYSLGEILSSLSRFIRDGIEPCFPSIEPALAEVLVRERDGKSEARGFWERHADKAVVNKFPVLTPLREEDAGLASCEAVSSMTFKTLSQAASNCEISIQTALQSAWARVLASYLGESSVVFGVTMSGRNTEITQDAPFPCITTVPVVARNVTSNRELMREMMAFNVELQRHQFSPLNQIQKWLGHPATPVFDTLVVYQRRESVQETERSFKLVKDEPMVEYAVSVEVEATAEHIRLRITHAKDVLPQEQASLLLRQFDATLQHLVCDLDDDEHGLYQKRPDLFAVTPAASPVLPAPVQLLHEFVERRAVTDPESTALEFVSSFDGDPAVRRWSYKEFDLMGDRAANLLRETTNVGDVVAIHFDKCPEAYISILGILKAGCSFVALDPHAPTARKDFILRDSQAKCLVTDVQITLDFDAPAGIVRIDCESLQRSPDRRPCSKERRLKPCDTCYCLYTSGTTGTPKGCEISHENAVQAMMAFQELFRGHWEPESRWLQFAALHFDVSVLEQYWSWSVGIAVVAAPRDLVLDDLAGAINRLGITHIDLTPSLARLTHPDEMPSLCRGVFITGGEQLRQEILDSWGPKAVIYNAYGPTEATIGVTMYPRVPVNGRPSNIGKQFHNVGSYVFHPGTEMPVLRGGVGELCVSGKLVGKGYLNRRELTKERFPTLARFGERVYRTGDLVRILHDGCFEFLGRADDQIKLRGQRLEIGEINHAIRTGVPELHNVATILVRREASGKDALVSFLVEQQNNGAYDLCVLPDTGGLGAKARAACLERLPSYMIPSYYLRLSRVPLSSNNKVESKELEALFAKLSNEQLMKLSAAAAPSQDSGLDRTVLEKVIRLVSDFSTVPADAISSSTSIFDIGVDSITALQLSTLLRRHGFPAASPALLLRHPIVADLARALSSNAVGGPQANPVREARQVIQACHHRHLALVCRELGLGPDEIEYIAPCSPLQQGIIFKAIGDEGSGAYFNSFELRLGNEVSLEKVRMAWISLVDSHAILRSMFLNTPDGYVQIALKRIKTPWREIMVRFRDEMDDVMGSERRSWINENKPHLVRPFELVHVQGPGLQRVFIHIFHALYDGNSLELMSRYASAIYHDEKPASAPLFIDALTHGPLQRYDHCRQFWIEHMRGWAPSPLPTLPAHTEEKRTVARTSSVSLSRLEELRSQQNVTLQSVVLALWTAVLQRHLGGKMSIGIIVAGRSMNLPDVERTIGPLFNTVPLFIRASRGRTWASLIREIHTFSTSTLPFQHVPLKSIQKWCSGGWSIFDNLFAFQIEQPNPTCEDSPWTIEDCPSHADYPLAFEATCTLGGELRVSLVAQSLFFDAAMLGRLIDQFEHELGAAQADGLVSPWLGDEDDGESGEESGQDGQGTETKATVFEWTDKAVLIREEVAILAGVPAEEVTAATTLLQLGLDSIDTMKLSARLKRKAINLSASLILRCQSIMLMVEQLELDGCDSPPIGLHLASLQEVRPKLYAQIEKAGLDLGTVDSVLPSTALQEAMVVGMVQSGFHWYFNHDILEVAEGVDTGRLCKAWEDVVESSPILRTGFVEVDDADLDMAYCQVTFRNPKLHIKFVRLPGLSEVSQVTSDATHLAREGQGLKNLVQLALVHVGHKRFVVLSMAHALYDGWSLGLMYRDLEVAYNGHVEARPSADSFISCLLATRTSDAHEFWQNYLAGVQPSFLARKDKPAEATSGRPLRRESVSKKPLSEVKLFCRKHSVSLQTLCAASWAMVVAARVGALDVVFGVVLSGRDGEGADDLMFPTMNTVALRCILHGTVSGLLQYLEESMVDVRKFQAFPLRRAHSAAKLRSSSSFDSLFLFQKPTEGEGPVSQLLRSIGGESTVEYPVCIEVEPLGGQLTWRIACHAQLFSTEETEALVEEADRVLQYILEHENEDVLSFHGEDVSICGMPAVGIKGSSSTDSGSETMTTSPQIKGDGWGKTENVIRDVLVQVSQVPAEAMTPQSSLYELGLDSISAIKVSILLRKRGLYLKPRELVQAPSIRELASAAGLEKESEELASLGWAPPSDIDTLRLLRECDIRQESVEMILPATSMQVYMLTAWQNSFGSVFFPEFCYRVKGAAEVSRVHEAWTSLVDEISILRTRFVATGSGDLPWLQVVIRKGEMLSCRVSQPLICLSVQRDELEPGLLLRLRIHHALYDGFSLPAVISRLGELMNGAMVGEEQGLAPWARHCIAPGLSDAKQRRRTFWTAYLGEGAVSPSSAARPTESTERVSYFDASAVKDIAPLRATASQNGISLQSLFLAGLATCLGRRDVHGGREAIVLGTYLANRTADEEYLTLAVNPTLNLAPVMVRLRRDGDLVALARSIQDDIHRISSDGRAEVGLWEIVAWTGVTVDYFVNFLASVPDERADADSDRQAEVTLTPAPASGDGSVTSEEASCSALLEQPWLQRNAVRDAYPPSVDVEASVQGLKLAMGVFGPRTRVSDGWAASLVAETAALLDQVGVQQC